VQSIVKSKPLSGDDIQSLPDAKKELKRIRKLMDIYKKSRAINNSATSNREKKHGRQAIHEKENINDYVKKVINKDKNVRSLIYDAIKTNVLFESNTEDELMEIIDVFEPCSFKASDVVIQQDEKDDYFYVVESGDLSITVRVAIDDEEDETSTDKSVNEVNYLLGSFHGGMAFGELALLYYGSPCAATIAVTSEECKLWRIRRSWYRGVVAQHRKRLLVEKVKFLSNVKVGKKTFGEVLSKDQLDTMAQLLKQEYFHKGETIVREGEAGNTFYIIQSGEVDLCKKGLGPIGTIGKGKYFGEKALLSDDDRYLTAEASTEKVVCYVMTRSEFTRMLGNLQDILDGKDSKKAVTFSTNVKKSRVVLKLDDLEVKNVLGEGRFGKVKLAKDKESGKYYALKAQNKQFILDNGQKTYIMAELRLMYKLNHPNVLMLHCAMQDKRYIYFLLDLLPGGGVMTLLERKGKLPEDWVRFYSASVVLAFTEFHRNRVAYRDLKPENMFLDANGYCVIVDLGLAKQLDDGSTYTFCGTPEYMAPELIRGIGYNWAVDYWSLGVLLVSAYVEMGGVFVLCLLDHILCLYCSFVSNSTSSTPERHRLNHMTPQVHCKESSRSFKAVRPFHLVLVLRFNQSLRNFSPKILPDVLVI